MGEQFKLGHYRPSIAYVELTRGLFSLIDSEDAPRAAGSNWSAQFIGKSWYACSKGRQLHRDISGMDGLQVDHVNLNGLDNRKINHRCCTGPQNRLNQGLRSDNSSGYKGVTFDRRRGRHFARIAKKFLGYGTPEECARLYDAAARVAFGEFAWLNFPEEKLGSNFGGEDDRAGVPAFWEDGLLSVRQRIFRSGTGSHTSG